VQAQIELVLNADLIGCIHSYSGVICQDFNAVLICSLRTNPIGLALKPFVSQVNAAVRQTKIRAFCCSGTERCMSSYVSISLNTISQHRFFLPLVFNQWESGDRLDTAPFLVRTARQQDLNHLADVLSSSFHTREGLIGWMYPLFRIGIYEDLRTRFRTKPAHYICLVAVKHPATQSAGRSLASEDLIGTVEMGLRSQSFWQPRSSAYLYVSNLAVQHDYRRQGVARQLLLTCEQVALGWGFRDLYLHVLENNQQARRLYRKAGYQLQHAESSLSHWLLRQPRQLLLHKRIE
jgi:ribosomal protein S18 acetylase RimI-like enzyme